MNSIEREKGAYQKVFVLTLVLIYVCFFIFSLGQLITPVLLAAVFASILFPVYNSILGKLPKHRSLSAAFTLLLAIIVVITPTLIICLIIADQGVQISEQAQNWFSQFSQTMQSNSSIESWLNEHQSIAPYRDKIFQKITELAGSVGLYLATSLGQISQGTLRFFLDLFVMIFAMFFFLLSGNRVVDSLFDLSPLSTVHKQKMIDVCVSVSRATVKGTLVIGMVQGALGGLGFAVAGLESAVFWATMMAVLSVLPGVGSALIWGPAVIYLFLIGDILAALGLLAWCVAVVSSIDNVLRPVLVGRDTQMPDLLILLSTLGGLATFGLSGIIFGPLLAALMLSVLAIYKQVFADWLPKSV